jgi:hypothetical protein
MKVIIESPGLEARGTAPDNSPIVKYLRSLGFEYTRTRSADGRSMLEFYLNLFDEPSMTAGSNNVPNRP